MHSPAADEQVDYLVILTREYIRIFKNMFIHNIQITILYANKKLLKGLFHGRVRH